MDLLSDIIEPPKIAPIASRMAACLIDISIFCLIGFAMGYFFGVRTTDQNTIGFQLTGAPALLLLLGGFGLVSIPEGLTGKTIGKRVMGIKVVQADFSNPSIGASIVRHLFDFIDTIFLVGLIVAAANAKKQRIGDLVGQTVVVVG